uniref:Uncharacterized protein n=1 Tax=Tanacetum cinerariifolium TaxID=118510 RepID=A0A6L2LLH4_TANCI|nr:hypothetical protein [Tanacetum cinerariifolium]
MQSRESKVVSSKALDASLVVTECSETKSDEHITSSSLGTYITHVVDADIRPVNDQEPSAEKCVFNANHDDCTTKFLKEVNSRTKVQSPKSRNNIKPAKRIPNVNKSERWMSKGYRFSPNKSFVVHEKPNTPRSCLRWKPTSRIFKTAGLRWIPTGKMFIDCTTKVDSEPLNGSNDDITNPYECDQTLNVSASTLNLSAGTSFNPKKERLRFNPPPRAVFLVLAAVAAPRAVDPAGLPSSTTIDQDVPSASTSPIIQEI